MQERASRVGWTVRKKKPSGSFDCGLGILYSHQREEDAKERRETVRKVSVLLKILRFFTLFITLRPRLDSRFHSQIPLCKKKIPHHIKMSAYVWSTKCR
jgi:hypothetical protein